MKVGDKITRPYPFQLFRVGDIDWLNCAVVCEFWEAGCKSNTEDGAELMPGYFETCHSFTCDKEGSVEIEILSIAEMPKRFKQRVIYKDTKFDPNGKKSGSSKVKIATVDKFKSMTEGRRSPFPYDYEED